MLTVKFDTHSKSVVVVSPSYIPDLNPTHIRTSLSSLTCELSRECTAQQWVWPAGGCCLLQSYLYRLKCPFRDKSGSSGAKWVSVSGCCWTCSLTSPSSCSTAGVTDAACPGSPARSSSAVQSARQRRSGGAR